MRAAIFTLVFSLGFGPVLQAAGHGSCHASAHAQHTASTAVDSRSAQHSEHTRHLSATAGDDVAAASAPDDPPAQCPCGCTCLPGHACSSVSVAVAVSSAGLDLIPIHHAPVADARGAATVDPKPHTRPPIAALR